MTATTAAAWMPTPGRPWFSVWEIRQRRPSPVLLVNYWPMPGGSHPETDNRMVERYVRPRACSTRIFSSPAG